MSGGRKLESSPQLLAQVRQNNPDAFRELSQKYVWLVREKARLFEGPSAPEREDLWQEGLLGLYIAAITYEEGGAASFSTYAGVCVYRRMADAARKHSSGKNRLLNESLPLESADASGAAAKESPEALIELRENFQGIRQKMEEVLSPLERRALILYVSGCEREEIPQKAGMSLKTFDNALHRARHKLKNL